VITRLIGLAALVVVILVGFSFVNGPEEGMYAKLVRAQEAMAVLPATATSTAFPLLPTPTATATAALASPSATVGAGTTPVAVGTAVGIGGTATPAPLTTATVTVALPPTFTPTPSATPFNEMVVGASGGQISSPDGHVQIAFPPGATTERLQIDVSDKPFNELQPLPVASHRLSAWTFNAKAIDRGYTTVHQFAQSFTLDLRYSAQEMFGLDETNIHYWTFDEVTSTWIESPATLVGDHEWTVSLNHFSHQAASADTVLKPPPILDNADVSPNNGAVTFNLPINVPPGLGGLQPAPTLNYSSLRVDQTALYTAAPWVGVGWDLSMPSVTRVVPASGGANRYFLNLNGAGGELIPLTTDPTSFVTRSQTFLDIRHNQACDDATITSQAALDSYLASYDCKWTVRDQGGHTYVFGGDQNSRRYYDAARIYQWDLAYVTDLHQNRADYAYTQVKGHSVYSTQLWDDWVFASYPSSIKYGGGEVDFNLSTNLRNPVFNPPIDFYTFQYRPDTGASCFDFAAPYPSPLLKAYELRGLSSVITKSQIGVQADGVTPVLAQTAEYDFSMSSLNSNCKSDGFRLDSVSVRGDNGGTLSRYSFGYGANGAPASEESTVYQQPDGSPPPPGSFDLQLGEGNPEPNWRVKSIDNGFGGRVSFALTEANRGYFGAGTWHRTTWTASSKTVSGGFDPTSNPDVQTSYQYSGFALGQAVTGDAYRPWYTVDGSGIAYRGFKSSTQATSGVTTGHEFTIGYDSPPVGFPNEGSNPKERAGRQVKTTTADGSGQWQQIDFGFQSDVVANTNSKAFFNQVASVKTTLRDSHQIETDYAYSPVHGGQTLKHEQGDIQVAGDCRDTIADYFETLTSTVYLLLPHSATIKNCDAPTATVDAQTVYFYDGRRTEASQSPTVGNVTAVRSLADKNSPPVDAAKQYAYTLNSYNSNGTMRTTSVPIYGGAASPLPADSATPNGDPWIGGRTQTDYSLDSGNRFPAAQTTYVFNPDGTAAQPPTQVTTFTYNLKQDLLETTTAPTGLIVGTSYDEWGRPTKRWQTPDDANYPTTSYDYSGWTGGVGQTGVNFTKVSHRLVAGIFGATITETDCFDGLGRETQTNLPYFKAGPNPADLRVQRSQATYNSRGLPSDTRLFNAGTSTDCAPTIQGPTAPNEFSPHNLTEYDVLGSVSKTTVNDGKSPAGNVASIVVNHVGVMTQTIDQLGHKKEVTVDGLGRTIRVDTFTGVGTTGSPFALYSTAKYEYDSTGNLSKARENPDLPSAASPTWEHDTVATYDALGRRLTATDPDRSGNPVTADGTSPTPWTFSYDAAGNLIGQTDARGVVTAMTYDSLNRIRTKSYTAPASSLVAIRPDSTFTYDQYDGTSPCSGNTAIGQLTIMSDSSGVTRWCYDPRAREVAKRHDIYNVEGVATSGALTFTTLHQFDSADRLQKLTYPAAPGTSAEEVSYTYDDLGGGKLLSMKSNIAGSLDYVSSAAYDDPSGALTTIQFGNGFKTDYTYDEVRRSKGIKTTSASLGVTAQDLAYSYQANGNIHEIKDSTATGDDLIFTYDDLDRITSADKAAGGSVSSYGYGTGADLGKLTSKTEGRSMNLAFNDPDHVHAVSATTPAPGDSFAYDNDGNISKRAGGETYTYDGDNRLKSWYTYPTQTGYCYDALGDLVSRSTSTPSAPGAADVKTTYVDGLYEQTSTFGAAPTVTKFYRAFGRLIAQRTGAAVTYILSDQVGSTVGTIDNANHVRTVNYYPYGRIRSGSVQTDKLFGGQQQEGYSRIGAYYYPARFYSSSLATFLSADSVTADGPNRYAYAKFNPVRYTDRSGHCVGGLPCGAAQVLNIAACANSLYDCALVFEFLGIPVYGSDGQLSDLLLQAFDFSTAAVQTTEFWINYYRFNPSTHLADLQDADYQSGNPAVDPITTLIGFAHETENRRFPSTANRVIDQIVHKLSSEECQVAVVGAIGLAGEATGNEEVKAAASVATLIIQAIHEDPEGARNDLAFDVAGSGRIQRALGTPASDVSRIKALSLVNEVYGVVESTRACIHE